MLKLFKPFVAKEAYKNVKRVLKSGQLAEGNEVKLFEQELKKALGLKNVVLLNSGSSALELAYELAEIKEGDEVITPVLTCTATNIPLARRGAKIIFADIDEDLNINIEDVKRKITPKTKAIVFVHFGGNNRGLRELLKLCKNKQIKVIEDAAQSIASDYWGKGDFTCVSFQAIKTITTGDGGFLVCKDKKDHEKAKKLKWFGYDREKKQKLGDIDLDLAGYKYHMNDISASIGRSNLKMLPKILEHQNKIAEIYKKYGLFANAWLAGGFIKNYEDFRIKMANEGIEIGQHHYRNDKYSIFGGRQVLPTMDKLENHYFFVPFHYEVTKKDAKKIGKIYENFIIR